MSGTKGRKWGRLTGGRIYQSTLRLTDKEFKMLEELCEKQGITKNTMLRNLIQSEYYLTFPEKRKRGIKHEQENRIWK